VLEAASSLLLTLLLADRALFDAAQADCALLSFYEVCFLRCGIRSIGKAWRMVQQVVLYRY
jgi:hypothetical protein